MYSISDIFGIVFVFTLVLSSFIVIPLCVIVSTNNYHNAEVLLSPEDINELIFRAQSDKEIVPLLRVSLEDNIITRSEYKEIDDKLREIQLNKLKQLVAKENEAEETIQTVLH